MIKVYVMETCPDCFQVKEQLKNNPSYSLIDIGENVCNLKDFLRMRDSNPIFDNIKSQGAIGIPCFVMENGDIKFSIEDIKSRSSSEGETCRLDGKGC